MGTTRGRKVEPNWYEEEEARIISEREASEREKEDKKARNIFIAALAIVAAFVSSFAITSCNGQEKRNEELGLDDATKTLMNGAYTNDIARISDEEARLSEQKRLLDEIRRVIASNLDINTRENDIVDLGSYVEDAEERELIRKVSDVTRNVVVASELSNKEYQNAITEYLSSMRTVEANSTYLGMSPTARFTIAGLFNKVGDLGLIPEEAYITSRLSEHDTRLADWYYMQFLYFPENKVYFPERKADGSIDYVYVGPDCVEERHTRFEMYALAGLLPYEEQLRSGILPDVNYIVQGLGPEMELRGREAEAELLNMPLEEVKTNGK